MRHWTNHKASTLSFLLKYCNGEQFECERFTKCKFPSLEMSSRFVKELESIYGSLIGISHNRVDFIVVF